MEATSERDELAHAASWLQAGFKVAVATVVRTWGSSPRPVGSHLVVKSNGHFHGSVSGGCVESAVISEATFVMDDGKHRQLNFGVTSEEAWEVGLPCGGSIRVLLQAFTGDHLDTQLAGLMEQGISCAMVTDLDQGTRALVWPDGFEGPLSMNEADLDEIRERLRTQQSGVLQTDENLFARVYAPQPRLILVGGVHIARVLAPMAALAGFAVTLVDPRTAYATPQRFPELPLVNEWPDEALVRLAPDSGTAVVTLSHDAKIDDQALIAALRSPAFYVGALGSRRTHEKRVKRLSQHLDEAQIASIHAPVGLNLGGRLPAQIAVSILAQIIQARYQPQSK